MLSIANAPSFCHIPPRFGYIILTHKIFTLSALAAISGVVAVVIWQPFAKSSSVTWHQF
jgi:hypothetical protein